MITYREKNGKFIICKDDVYIALTLQQVNEMEDVIKDIKDKTIRYHKKDSRG